MSATFHRLLSFLLSALYFQAASASFSSPIITVKNGSYVGRYNPTYNEDEFLGIPYAQPPLGYLRFRGPAGLNTTWNGTRKATNYSPICVGYGSDSNYFNSPEDCLTINVVRPTGQPSEPLPVIVWLYGGGFYEGGTQDQRYNLSRIVQQSIEANKPMIAVLLNYRLSAFGFLRSKEVAANGEYGAFGGDQRKVTLWGESAGGIAIGRHLVAYGGRDDGLYRAAIMESGGPLERWPYATPYTNGYSEELYTNLMKSTGCHNATSPLECLRYLQFSQPNAALNITDTWIAGTGLGPWVSVIDNDFLQDYCSTQINDGRFVKLPILYGTNTDEGTAISPHGINTDEDFRAAVAQGGADNCKRSFEKYLHARFSSSTDRELATISMIEKLYSSKPALGIPVGYNLTASDIATYGKQWKRGAAFFGDVPAGLADIIGVTYYQEVAWVFDNIDGAGYATNPFNVSSEIEREKYVEAATAMSRMWASFVSDFDPNGHGLDGWPRWPRYRAEEGKVGKNMVFDANGSWVERDDWRIPQMAFLAEKALSQWKHRRGVASKLENVCS
ncbi:related to carboxylesterase type B [Phialocephala subalpina]|uniref:Carboxylic ester hydrolase n=1 Tax=Phialocephala subalpina TaxID=576137 RepID=A0A1L7XE54_9HELO|nr:related to carboxylesterase type B [Phialocephala subalpina]